MKILVIDVGGTHVKILATGLKTHREIPSGQAMSARKMVTTVKRLAGDWQYDAVSIGYPGPVLRGRPVIEPQHIGGGWVGFDFRKAFGCPVRIVNDATMPKRSRHYLPVAAASKNANAFVGGFGLWIGKSPGRMKRTATGGRPSPHSSARLRSGRKLGSRSTFVAAHQGRVRRSGTSGSTRPGARK